MLSLKKIARKGLNTSHSYHVQDEFDYLYTELKYLNLR